MKFSRRVFSFSILFSLFARIAYAGIGSELNRFENEDAQRKIEKKLQSQDEPVSIQVDGADAGQTSRSEQPE